MNANDVVVTTFMQTD